MRARGLKSEFPYADKVAVFAQRSLIAYNHDVRLLPHEPLVVEQPQSRRVEGTGIVMKSCEFLESVS